jgi:hypothetical protein
LSAIINGSSPSVTFSDGTTQATSAIVSGYVPYANLPAGSVLQVVSSTKTDAGTSTATSYTDITGLTLSITPKSSSSKILLFASVVASVENTNARGIALKFAGGNTASYIGATAGSRVSAAVGMKMESTNFNYYFVPFPFNMLYLDSPATTSAITYSVQAKATNGSATIYFNQAGQDSDNASHIRTASTITAMEIAG